MGLVKVRVRVLLLEPVLGLEQGLDQWLVLALVQGPVLAQHSH